MKFLARALPSTGKKLGGKSNGVAKTLGMKLASIETGSGRHFLEERAEHVTSGLEKNTKIDRMENSARHIPRDGQVFLTHGLAPTRQAWQRKKNH